MKFEEINLSDKLILKDDFKKYEQNKNKITNNINNCSEKDKNKGKEKEINLSISQSYLMENFKFNKMSDNANKRY